MNATLQKMLVVIALMFLWPLLLLCALATFLYDGRPIFHWSKRIGQDNVVFMMPKFRTMKRETPQVATHLLNDANIWITPVGKIMRRTSLDELPQCWSVLRGDMAIVGPRPALYNQDDLVAQRTEIGVHQLKPGITGFAQVNGRDELSIECKVAYDYEYLKKRSIFLDIKIIILTICKLFRPSDIAH